MFRRATEYAVKVQLDCGIDVPTDGEQRRENYVHYQCRQFQGFDFRNPERRVLRNGAYNCLLPAIRNRVASGRSVLVRDFLETRAACPHPVTMTLPGPLTIMDCTADCHYRDDMRLADGLAATLNLEVLALAEAGCRHIQIDEPVFARKPAEALSCGMDALERCFRGVNQSVVRTVRMCCGNPDRLDNPDHPKADHRAYHDLLEALDAKVDAISIEDAHRHNDLELFRCFRRSTAIVGVIRIVSSTVEPIEAIRSRL